MYTSHHPLSLSPNILPHLSHLSHLRTARPPIARRLLLLLLHLDLLSRAGRMLDAIISGGDIEALRRCALVGVRVGGSGGWVDAVCGRIVLGVLILEAGRHAGGAGGGALGEAGAGRVGIVAVGHGAVVCSGIK